MKIYISGITGTAMGALALFAKEAGLTVSGSDQNSGAVYPELVKAGIETKIGKQDGKFLEEKFNKGEADWFVYTSALPKNHPELLKARQLGMRVSKRDELIEAIRKQFRLKMVAVAGTHGKTTTTSMIIFACQKLGIKVSYLVGTTLPFCEAGKYDIGSKFLIYEADEYDRNFLHFSPWLSVITCVDYDHPDIYPTKEDYEAAFIQFIRQSKSTIVKSKIDKRIKLEGKIRKIDGTLAKNAIVRIVKELKKDISEEEIINVLNQFPGAGRRFEEIHERVFSDYAHHPIEIKSTIEMAVEKAKNINAKGVVVVYEPHQNTRQHEVFDLYKDVFLKADKLFWLPTFLTRENEELLVYNPEDFIRSLSNSEIAEKREKNEKFGKELLKLQKDGYLILLMSAGPADAWLRSIFKEK